jgi:hypothetical protein
MQYKLKSGHLRTQKFTPGQRTEICGNSKRRRRAKIGKCQGERERERERERKFDTSTSTKKIISYVIGINSEFGGSLRFHSFFESYGFIHVHIVIKMMKE